MVAPAFLGKSSTTISDKWFGLEAIEAHFAIDYCKKIG